MPQQAIYMLILNLKKINSFFKENLDIYTKLSNYGHLECPNCHSSALIKYGSYTRNVIYISDDNLKIESCILKVQRVKCKSCGKTHALLPQGIIPYKQFSSNLVTYLLNGIVKGNTKKLIETLPIDESILKKLYKQFKEKHFSRLKIMLFNKPISECLDIIENNVLMREEYIVKYNCCFMQIKLGCIGIGPS